MAEKKVELTKEEKLDLLIKKLDKDFGKGTIITNENLPEVKRFSSGSFSLDKALGGGWAKGRIIELIGNESSAKTSIALHAVAEIQKLGGLAAYIDVENCLRKGSLIFDANKKIYRTVEELYKDNKDFSVISLDKNNKQIFNKAKIKKVGKQKTFKLKTERGRNISLTKNHKVLTKKGYKKVEQLKIGDILYIPHNIKTLKDNVVLSEQQKDEFRMLGLYVGDGCKNKCEISNIDFNIIKDYKNILNKWFNCELVNQGINRRAKAKDSILGVNYKFSDNWGVFHS